MPYVPPYDDACSDTCYDWDFFGGGFFLVHIGNHALLGALNDDFIPSHHHKGMSATVRQCSATVAGAALANSYLSKLSIQCLVHALFVYVCSTFLSPLSDAIGYKSVTKLRSQHVKYNEKGLREERGLLMLEPTTIISLENGNRQS